MLPEEAYKQTLTSRPTTQSRRSGGAMQPCRQLPQRYVLDVITMMGNQASFPFPCSSTQVEAHTIVREWVTLTTKQVASKKADLVPKFAHFTRWTSWSVRLMVGPIENQLTFSVDGQSVCHCNSAAAASKTVVEG